MPKPKNSNLNVNYKKAMEALKADELITPANINPIWIGVEDQFAYFENDSCFIYDPAKDEHRFAFDRGELLTALNTFLQTSGSGTEVTLDLIEFVDQGESVKIAGQTGYYHIRIEDLEVTRVGKLLSGDDIHFQALSPDGKKIAYIKDHNVYLHFISDGNTRCLNSDGIKDNAYLGADDTDCYQLAGPPDKRWSKQQFLWSPDSKYIAVYKLDQTRVPVLHLLDNSISPAILKSLHYAYPGSPDIFKVSLFVIDVDGGTIMPIQDSRHDFQVAFFLEWSPEGDEIYFIGFNRGHSRLDLLAFNPTTIEIRSILTEEFETHIEDTYIIFRRLKDSGRFIWASERNGWNHLYLYSLHGQCLHQITRGDFPVNGVVSVNEKDEVAYFAAADDNHDPYFQHLFQVSLDGNNQKKITQKHAMHTISASPTSTSFVIHYSAPDMPQHCELIDHSGKLIKHLAISDIESWHAAGWNYPESFYTTAADGVTSLYGLMYKPSDFDASRKYPLIEYVYPGPITFTAPKIFIPNDKNQALSELGFIVIVMDGRGTLGRGKSFQDFSYANFGQYELIDHVAAIEQLAEKHGFIDRSRVGIYGRSAGGYAAARGVLQYPDVYHVGVAICGHHDYRKYNWYWVEQYCGLPENNAANYAQQANAALAKNLQGKLMLIHGTMDDNVFPDHTVQLADALISENKNVDICMVPTQRHEFEGRYEEFCTRKIWDFFC